MRLTDAVCLGALARHGRAVLQLVRAVSTTVATTSGVERKRVCVLPLFLTQVSTVDGLAGLTGVDAVTAMTTIAQLIGWDPLTQTAQVRFPFLPPLEVPNLTPFTRRTRPPYSEQ